MIQIFLISFIFIFLIELCIFIFLNVPACDRLLEIIRRKKIVFHWIGEGNGNPLQCSCLENPRDGGVWWAAVYGVAQSRTRRKWLSSSRLHERQGFLLSSPLFFVWEMLLYSCLQLPDLGTTFFFWLCHTTYGILVPPPGVKPMPLH